jgi:hypothetical protein
MSTLGLAFSLESFAMVTPSKQASPWTLKVLLRQSRACALPAKFERMLHQQLLKIVGGEAAHPNLSVLICKGRAGKRGASAPKYFSYLLTPEKWKNKNAIITYQL